MGEAFEILAEGLAPFVDRRMAAHIPDDEWILVAAAKLGKRADFLVTVSDPQFQLDVLNRFWGPVFAAELDPGLRSVITELRTARNHWANIDDDHPIDLEYAQRVNHLAEDLLAGVGADGAERLATLSENLRWSSVRADSAQRGVSDADALISQLAELQAERTELQDRLDEARREAASATGRTRAVARQLAELQTRYAAVADLSSRYVTLQRQLHELETPPSDTDTLTLTGHARAHAGADTDAALAGLTDESAELRRKLQEARQALETVNPAETPEGQRWMWLIAGLLVSLSIVILLVATGVSTPATGGSKVEVEGRTGSLGGEMLLLLTAVFLIVPIVELWVIVAAAQTFGVPETLVVLIIISVAGAWLVKWAGLGVLMRMQKTVRKGAIPAREVVDGFLVLLAGALLLTPGFFTDFIALALLFPPTRAPIRRLILRRYRGRLEAYGVHDGANVTDTYFAYRGRRDGVVDVDEVDDFHVPVVVARLAPRARFVTTAVDVEVRDAATVLLVRDGRRGLEVAMLRRRLESIFARGAYVFPGGAVDAEDRDPCWAARTEGLDDAWASDVLGTPSGALAFWVAAVRECFEEAGVLLARRGSGADLGLSDGAEAERFHRHRLAVDRGQQSLWDLFQAEDLCLPVGDLHYFSHWITPEGAPRRYDTRFFVARAPEDQRLSHDDGETIAALWARPAEALDRNADGNFELIYPTMRSLETLTHYADADAVLAAVAAAPVGLESP